MLVIFNVNVEHFLLFNLKKENRHQILMINDKQWRNVRKKKKFRLTHMPWHYALFVSSRHICLYVCTVCTLYTVQALFCLHI